MGLKFRLQLHESYNPQHKKVENPEHKLKKKRKKRKGVYKEEGVSKV